MTLRESERSLLHTLHHAGRSGSGNAQARQPLRLRVPSRLNIILAGASAAIMLVMAVILMSETFERELALIDVTKPELSAALNSGWKNQQNGNGGRQTSEAVTMTVDVIIPDAGNQPAQDLKHLTREPGAGFLSAFEVSRETVMRALARSEIDNVVISSQLKFYRPRNGHKILACSDRISPYINTDTGTANPGQSSCFLIDTTPHQGVVFPTGKIL